MFQRAYFQELTTRLNEPRKFIQVLMGPRQVGKSTLLEQVLQKLELPFLSVSADAVPNTGDVWLEQQWEAARLQHQNSGSADFILAIDEIQKISNWSVLLSIDPIKSF